MSLADPTKTLTNCNYIPLEVGPEVAIAQVVGTKLTTDDAAERVEMVKLTRGLQSVFCCDKCLLRVAEFLTREVKISTEGRVHRCDLCGSPRRIPPPIPVSASDDFVLSIEVA